MIYRERIEPRYSETDKMGIIYHANYITWFEISRTKLSDHLGLPVRELEELGMLFPVLKVACEYKSPVAFGDDVEVEVLMTKYTGVRLCYEYTVFNKTTGKIAATGSSQSGVTNAELIPKPVKSFSTKVDERFRAYHEECLKYLEK
ncbi:acyl-CoA thioesterase [Guggenheimella bovis]